MSLQLTTVLKQKNSLNCKQLVTPPNVFRLGATRKGKTMASVRDTFFLAATGMAIIVLDPHGTLIDRLLPLLVMAGYGPRVFFDKLGEMKHVLGFEFLAHPQAKEWIEKRREMDLFMSEFIDCCLFRRGLQNEYEHQWYSFFLRLALRVFLNQKIVLPLFLLPYALKVGCDQFTNFYTHCIDKDARYDMRRLAKDREWQKQAIPAERILTSLCQSATVMPRCQASFDLLNALLNGAIILISGRGVISEGSKRDFFGLLIRRVSQLIREYYNQYGKPLLVRLVIDEALNYRLISQYEVRDILEMQKGGLSIDIISQMICEDPEIMDGILEGCNRQEYFALNSDRLAKFAADQAGVPLLDPFAVHHVDIRKRQVIDGYDTIQTSSTSHGQSGENPTENETVTIGERPRYRDEIEKTERFWQLNDQLLMVRKEIRTLGVGWRIVVENGQVRKEYVPLLKPRGKNINAKVQEFLTEMRSQQCFQKPYVSLPKMESLESPNGTDKSSKSSKTRKRWE